MIDWKNNVKRGLAKNYEIYIGYGEDERTGESEYQIEISQRERSIFNYNTFSIYGLHDCQRLRLSIIHNKIDLLPKPDCIYINGDALEVIE